MTFFNRVKGMLDNFVSSKLANANGKEKLSSSEEEGLQEEKVQFAESNQLSGDNSEYDWYCWIDHLISLEPHKAIEKLEADISELEEEISELEEFVQCKHQKKLKSDIEIDLKFVKCLAQHFNNPEEVIKELKSYIDEDKSRKSNKYTSRAENRINSHIILVKYFIEETCKKVSTQTVAFMQNIESQDRNQKKRNSWTGREPKKEIESPYAASDEKTAKQYIAN